MQIKENGIIREPVGRIMAKISRMFLTQLQRNLSHLDIGRSFYPLLLISAGNGNLTQQELAEMLSCNKVQAVRIIDYLSSNGYVKRVQNTDDRRKYNLEITAKAIAILPDIERAITDTTALAVETISQIKVDEMYVLLRIIENNLVKNQIRK
jgi:MarR family transcriptional regulator for hemolysin